MLLTTDTAYFICVHFSFDWRSVEVDSPDLCLEQNYRIVYVCTCAFEHVHKINDRFLSTLNSVIARKVTKVFFFLVEIRSCCANKILMCYYKL